MSAHVWEQFHEYMINHYNLLDKEARAYADEISDQLDASVKQRIHSLPEGRERDVLSRKLSMVRAERCPIPVIYLDTPVIENIIRHALGHRLDEFAQALYEEVMALVKDGKLICPEDNFHREALQMGGSQAREGLNIIRMLSEGLSFKHSQSIEDFQAFRALRGFIDGNGPVNYRKFWRDAFQKETVNAIIKKRSSIVFEGALGLAEKAGAAASQQAGLSTLSTRLRIRYDEVALKKEHQLQQRSTRHLRDLVRLGMKYQSLRGEAPKRRLDGFWAGQKIDLPVALWNHYGGKPEGLEGLISFYASKHFRDVPAVRVKQQIWQAFSGGGEGVKRVTWPADVNILSSILPYTDIMILGRNMTDTVRDRLRLDLGFDTEIYSVDEQDLIMAALKDFACPDRKKYP
jgi:hypothetical protein